MRLSDKLDFKLPYREQNSNKGTFGKVLNFAGSKNYIGAAYLSSISALKIGAGYIALATEKNIIKTVSIMLPDAVYLSREQGVKQIENYDIVMIGCGLGQTIQSKYLFDKVVKKAKELNKTTVIDADGLNILSTKDIDLPQNTIITPHPAEAARLLGVNVSDVLNDLENSAKTLSKKYDCITVLKTHRTIICDKNLNIHVNQNGNSALAKAGSGDVLAGILSGLLAQGMNLFEAVKLGVYLHARTGEIASEELTEYSVLASDLPKYLPRAIKELL